MTFGTGGKLGVDFTEVYNESQAPSEPAPPFVVGTIEEGTDGSEWVFVQASGSLGVGDAVQLDEDWVATGLTTSNALFGSLVGIVPVAAVNEEYLWVQRKGEVPVVNVATSAAANAALNTTATAGRLDDDGANPNVAVTGIALTAAESSNQAPGILNYPTIGEVIPA